MAEYVCDSATFKCPHCGNEIRFEMKKYENSKFLNLELTKIKDK